MKTAIAMIAVADRGSMLDASAVFYMEKLVAGWEGIGVLDIRQSIGENIRALAAAKKKPVDEMRIAVLDRTKEPGAIGEPLYLDVRAAVLSYTSPWNLTGLPAISLPAGFHPTHGWPMGVQLIGKPQGDLALLQVAAAYEAVRGDWLQRRPG
mgnify:CR=1 FL=1